MAAAGTKIIRLTVDASQAERAVRGITRSFGTMETAARGVNTALYRMQSIFAVFGVGFAADSLFQMVDAMTAAENRMRTYAKTTEEVIELEDALFDVAHKTYTTYESTSTIFNRLTMVTKGLGYSYGDLLDVTEALNATFILSGSTMQEARSAALQLSQGLSSATLQGEELRAVLESNRFLSEIIAEEFQTTVGNLRLMASEGELSSGRIVKAISDHADELRKKMESWQPTISQAMGVVTTEFGRFLMDVNRANGVAKTFADVLMVVGNNIESVVLPGLMAIAMVALPAVIGAIKTMGIMLLSNPITAFVTLAAAGLTFLYTKAQDDTMSFLEFLGGMATIVYDTFRLWGYYIARGIGEGLQAAELMIRNLLPRLANLAKDILPTWLAPGPRAELADLSDTIVQLGDVDDRIKGIQIDIANTVDAIFGLPGDPEEDGLAKALKALLEQLNGIKQTAPPTKDELKELAKMMKTMQKIAEDSQEDLGSLVDEYDKFRRGIDDTYKASQELLEVEQLLHRAVQAGIASTAEAERMMYLYKESLKDASTETDEASKIWERAAKRIDKAFADAWAGSFESFKDFAKNLGAGFRQLLGEMLHLAITHPIVVQVSAAMGGTLGIPAAANAAGAAGSTGLLGQAGNFLSFGTAGTGLFGLGSISGGLSTMAAGFGMLGSGVSGSLGAGLGMIAGGALPMLLPALGIMAALGLFGGKGDSTPDLTIGTDVGKGTDLGVTRGDFWGNVSSQFGQFGLMSQHDFASDQGAAQALIAGMQNITAIEDRIAAGLTEAAITTVQGALEQLPDRIKTENAPEEAEALIADFINQRFDLIFEAIGGPMDTLFLSMTANGADAETAAAAIMNMMDSIDRLGDYATDAADAVEAAGWTQWETYQAQRHALIDLNAAWDGSLEGTEELRAGLEEFRMSAIQMAVVIDQVRDSINKTIESTRQTIETSLMSDEEKYAYLREQAEQMAAELESAVDPARIQELTSSITRILGESWQMQMATEGWANLSPEEQAAAQTEYLQTLDQVQETANARLTEAEDRLQAQVEDVNTRIATRLEQIGDTYNRAATTMLAAAETPQRVEVVVRQPATAGGEAGGY